MTKTVLLYVYVSQAALRILSCVAIKQLEIKPLENIFSKNLSEAVFKLLSELGSNCTYNSVGSFDYFILQVLR